MYAIIEDSGSQIKVSSGDVVDIDTRELEEGATSVVFDRVLAIGGTDGLLNGNPGLMVKYKRRKGYRNKVGHRQDYLRVRIGEISGA